MQKQSLFRKYFMLFSMSLVLSILVLGVILLAFASQYFQDERYDLLERNAVQASAYTSVFTNSNYVILDRDMVASAYTVLTVTVDSQIFLTNLSGEVLLSAGTLSRELEQCIIPQEAVDRASLDRFQMTTNLAGVFNEPHYIVGVPVRVGDQTIGALFAASSANSLKVFLVELGKMFLFSAAVVVLVASVITYLITIQLVRPLHDMLFATQSFAQGDFSKRVPVGSYDELGQLAMAFNNMASTLATTEQTRRSFVANVSHELKTPMTTIGGFVDGILDGTVPEEKRDQYLQVVSAEVKRLARLVRSMLDTARIEAGELELNMVTFDLSETIRQTIFAFEQVIEEKQLEIRGLEVDKVMVLADKDLMHQVVYNLVENAVKFVNQGGYIAFRYQSDGSRTYVAIRNSGEGISAAEASQLFERFYKSDKSRSLNKSGAGLGLHIVRTLVNYHRGDIVVRSLEGEYTEFEFSIPDPPPAKPPKSKKPPEA